MVQIKVANEGVRDVGDEGVNIEDKETGDRVEAAENAHPSPPHPGTSTQDSNPTPGGKGYSRWVTCRGK